MFEGRGHKLTVTVIGDRNESSSTAVMTDRGNGKNRNRHAAVQ